MIYDLIPIVIAGVQTQCRPFEFDDNADPTAVVVSHTTCPSCSGRVIVNHITCDNLINVGGINYIYCIDCGYGKEEFQKLKDIAQGRVVYDGHILARPDCECDFEVVMSIPLVDWSATKYINNLSSEYTKREEPQVGSSHKDIIQKMIK